jgi:tRNA-2-methylthio-N6-dimethylallyladenosine synthase
VHFTPGGTGDAPRPGDIVTTVVTRGAPTYLLADGIPLEVRRTRGGDAWAARQAVPSSAESTPGDAPAGVLLGMPTTRPAG